MVHPAGVVSDIFEPVAPRHKIPLQSLPMPQDDDAGYKLLFSAPEVVRDLVLGFIPDAWLHGQDSRTRVQHFVRRIITLPLPPLP